VFTVGFQLNDLSLRCDETSMGIFNFPSVKQIIGSTPLNTLVLFQTNGDSTPGMPTVAEGFHVSFEINQEATTIEYWNCAARLELQREHQVHGISSIIKRQKMFLTILLLLEAHGI
jgi:hypothetical protein